MKINLNNMTEKMNDNKQINSFYFYTFWIFIWSVLYLFKFINICPLISAILSSIFVLYLYLYHFIDKLNMSIQFVDYTFKIVILLILILGILRHKKIKINILSELIVFTIYLIFLKLNNISFNKIYYEELPKLLTMLKQKGIFSYIQYRIKNLF